MANTESLLDRVMASSKPTDKIRLSVAVVHVPGADPKRNLLVRRLKHQFRDRLSIVRDLTRAGCWPTSLRAAQQIAPGATHHMVVHDHAIVVDTDALTRVIAAAPESWICPYAPRRELVEVEGNWASIQGTWGTANIAPVALWDEFRRWARGWTMSAETDHDDRRIGAWMQATGRAAAIPIPNVVDHTGAKSLLGHSRAISRSSRVLVGRDRQEPTTWGSPVGAKRIATTPWADVIKNVNPNRIEQFTAAYKAQKEVVI